MHNYRIILELSSTSNSTTCTPQSLFEPLPSHTPQNLYHQELDWQEVQQRGNNNKLEYQPSTTGKEKEVPEPAHDYRFGPISVDWLDIKHSKGKKKRVLKSTGTDIPTSSSTSDLMGPAPGSQSNQRETGTIASGKEASSSTRDNSAGMSRHTSSDSFST